MATIQRPGKVRFRSAPTLGTGGDYAASEEGRISHSRTANAWVQDAPQVPGYLSAAVARIEYGTTVYPMTIPRLRASSMADAGVSAMDED